MISQLLIQIFLLLLPAGFANMAPVFFKKVNILNYPVDLGIKYRGYDLFGKNKTYRGFLFGILVSIIIVYIQKIIYQVYPSISKFFIIDYSAINIFLLGFLLGFGALFGDLIESFFKRRLNIKPGRPWIPFDQIDWILGSLIFVNFYIKIPLVLFILALLLFAGLHFLIRLIGFKLKINDSKL